ncbi:TraB/GumN family protein [uncultured Kriegella sp.]|uniref:TraB/GumN family protein n=1 Tax=uncultured Kriegella sp. TaxID=1798910 RepID=UPI0030D7344C|tara:strand:+ start:49772 stop:50653 length:882 start_codon:yes stop_codon:yes gene_type:complete
MNTREIITLLLLLWTSTSVLGQNNRDTLLNNTVLFKVTAENSTKTSYIFGTHHAFGKSFFDSLTTANKALSASEILIKENLNIPGHTAEEIINSRKKVVKWRTYLDQNDLTFIKNLFAKSPTDFNKMTPAEMYAFLNRHFKQYICLNKSSNDTSLSLDDYIGFKAKEQQIALYGLETSAEQIALINEDIAGMPKRTHKRRLKNSIAKIRSENNKDCGETDWYAQMKMDYQLHSPCSNTLILTDRNNKWMKKIKELLETKNCFIAVGLSHLMYDCGLINQLQQLGYTITPMGLE